MTILNFPTKRRPSITDRVVRVLRTTGNLACILYADAPETGQEPAAAPAAGRIPGAVILPFQRSTTSAGKLETAGRK